jgi:hypothetical protein
VAPDENDHFVGGPPTPANCDGVSVFCTYSKIGEIDDFIDRLLLTQRNNTTPFTVHSDSAPTFYLTGNPAQTTAVTRTLEHDVQAVTAQNPITNATDKLSVFVADRAVMNLEHMITSAADRSPTFTMFGNPDYFNEVASSSQGHGTGCFMAPSCVVEGPAFAWNHGDVQRDITRTWFGMVGPGIKTLGRNDGVFSDHSDLRPTILALLGLTDDYVSDGRALVEFVQTELVKNRDRFTDLAKIYKEINAPVGKLGLAALTYANRSIAGSDDDYNKYLTTISDITSERNSLTSQMISLLSDAVFLQKPIGDQQEDALEREGKALVEKVQKLAGCGSHRAGDDASLQALPACQKIGSSDAATSTASR